MKNYKQINNRNILKFKYYFNNLNKFKDLFDRNKCNIF